MVNAKQLYKKHLKLCIPKNKWKSEKELIQLRYDASISAIEEAMNTNQWDNG